MEVKGTAIAANPRFIREKFGEAGFQRWLNALHPGAREIYGKPIMVSAFFPIKEALVEPTEKICELFYGGDLKGAWEAGRFSAYIALENISKAFIKLGSIRFIIQRASRIMPSYYIPSEMQIVEDELNHALLRITQFPEMHRVIEYRIGGWIQRALEMGGGRDLKVEITKSLALNDHYTEFIISWK